jgi:hypothetical protein
VTNNASNILALAHASGCPIGANPALWLLGQKMVRKTGKSWRNEAGRRVFDIEITPKGRQLLDDLAGGHVPLRAEGGG